MSAPGRKGRGRRSSILQSANNLVISDSLKPDSAASPATPSSNVDATAPARADLAQLNWLLLFDRSDLEQAFGAYSAAKSLSRLFSSMVSLLTFMSVMTALEYLLLLRGDAADIGMGPGCDADRRQADMNAFLGFRLASICISISFVSWAYVVLRSLSPSNASYWAPYRGICLSIPTGTSMAFLALAGVQAAAAGYANYACLALPQRPLGWLSVLYDYGIVLCLLMSGLRWTRVATLSILHVAACLGTFIGVGPVRRNVEAGALLVFATGAGVLAAYRTERIARHGFVSLVQVVRDMSLRQELLEKMLPDRIRRLLQYGQAGKGLGSKEGGSFIPASSTQQGLLSDRAGSHSSTPVSARSALHLAVGVDTPAADKGTRTSMRNVMSLRAIGAEEQTASQSHASAADSSSSSRDDAAPGTPPARRTSSVSPAIPPAPSARRNSRLSVGNLMEGMLRRFSTARLDIGNEVGLSTTRMDALTEAGTIREEGSSSSFADGSSVQEMAATPAPSRALTRPQTIYLAPRGRRLSGQNTGMPVEEAVASLIRRMSDAGLQIQTAAAETGDRSAGQAVAGSPGAVNAGRVSIPSSPSAMKALSPTRQASIDSSLASVKLHSIARTRKRWATFVQLSSPDQGVQAGDTPGLGTGAGAAGEQALLSPRPGGRLSREGHIMSIPRPTGRLSRDGPALLLRRRSSRASGTSNEDEDTAALDGYAPPAHYYPSVSVLFIYVGRFTEVSGAVQPLALVSFLNRLYRELDRIVQEHGCYKVMAIANLYLVVAGAPEPLDNHVVRLASCGLSILKFSASRPDIMHVPGAAPMQLQGGLHTGELAAGVIGIRTLNWHVYGDTVNTASRMCSTGTGGKLQVSSTACSLLSSDTTFPSTGMKLVARGQVYCKGKGMMDTAWLTDDWLEAVEHHNAVMASSRRQDTELHASPGGSFSSHPAGSLRVKVISSGTLPPGPGASDRQITSSTLYDRSTPRTDSGHISQDRLVGDSTAVPIPPLPHMLTGSSTSSFLAGKEAEEGHNVDNAGAQDTGARTRVWPVQSTPQTSFRDFTASTGASPATPATPNPGAASVGRYSVGTISHKLGAAFGGQGKSPAGSPSAWMADGDDSAPAALHAALAVARNLPSSGPAHAVRRGSVSGVSSGGGGGGSSGAGRPGSSASKIRPEKARRNSILAAFKGGATSPGRVVPLPAGQMVQGGVPSSLATSTLHADGSYAPSGAISMGGRKALPGNRPQTLDTVSTTLPSATPESPTKSSRADEEARLVIESAATSLLSLRFLDEGLEIRYARKMAVDARPVALATAMAGGFSALVATLFWLQYKRFAPDIDHDVVLEIRVALTLTSVVAVFVLFVIGRRMEPFILEGHLRPHADELVELHYSMAMSTARTRAWPVRWVYAVGAWCGWVGTRLGLQASTQHRILVLLVIAFHLGIDLSSALDCSPAETASFLGGSIEFNVTLVMLLPLFEMPLPYNIMCLAMITVSFILSTQLGCVPALPASLALRITALLFACAGSVALCYSREAAARYAFTVQEHAQRQQKRCANLLGNMLPSSRHVALLLRGEHVVESLPRAAMLYSDIVGFTELCGKLTPAQLILLLDELYSEFDACVAELGLYKVETIGDAFIAVGGIDRGSSGEAGTAAPGAPGLGGTTTNTAPSTGGSKEMDREAQVAAAVRACAILSQRMLAQVSALATKTGLPLAIRVGVHVDEAVGGVIGSSRPRYFIWGKGTVMANAMESTGVPGKCQVSQDAAAYLVGAGGVVTLPGPPMQLTPLHVVHIEDGKPAGRQFTGEERQEAKETLQASSSGVGSVQVTRDDKASMVTYLLEAAPLEVDAGVGTASGTGLVGGSTQGEADDRIA